MSKVPKTLFGRDIRDKLEDRNETQEWLIARVREDTDLFFDSSYLFKIMTGRKNTPKIVASICKILDIEYP